MVHDALFDHPAATIACCITFIGTIIAFVFVVIAAIDRRRVMAGNGAGRFMGTYTLQGSLIHFCFSLLLLLLTLRTLGTVIDALDAVPRAQRAVARARMRHVTTAQIEALVLYFGLVVMSLAEDARLVIGRRLFDRKYGSGKDARDDHGRSRP